MSDVNPIEIPKTEYKSYDFGNINQPPIILNPKKVSDFDKKLDEFETDYMN